MTNPASDPALGRWATLKDAAAVLELTPNRLLKQIKRGKRRGTQIGNNWFVYIEPEIEHAVADKARAAEEKRALRAEAVARLRQENQALREEVEALKASGSPAPVQREDTLGQRLVPLLDVLERQHKSMVGEIDFLRSELVAVRQQHAEEMRRKDILIQQAHKSLQDLVKVELPKPAKEPPAPAPQPAPDVEQLRQDQMRMSRVMSEMSELLTMMYRRLMRQEKT
ncbi:hypothetical protein [Iodidimonas sp. SYSU 1G8]|uniref:hypothetical protein n=1 Tax=Iodidimonas sp. SYSU 1G8 TaxID=3133967 RepID=UPI0031FF25C5